MINETSVQPLARAPEIKAGTETVNEAFDGFMQAFEAFRDANDTRLDEIEKKLGADVLTREKVDRINRSLDEQKRKLDQLELKKARPSLAGGRGADANDPEHKSAFEAYMRRGDEGGLRALESKGLASSADGGYVVPEETDSEIGRRLSVISPIRALSSVRRVSTSVLKKPFALSGMATGWVGEAQARPETQASLLSELAFETMELYAMPAATQALLDDAAVDVEAWIASEVEIAFAEQESAAFVAGDGQARPKGFLSYDNVPDNQWGWGKIGYKGTGAQGAFAAAGPADTLIDAAYLLKAAHRQNATFVMNRSTQAEIRKFKDADGNYLWQPPAQAGQPASLVGYPVVEAEDMPDIAIGAFAIAIGDFRAGYLVVDRMGVRVLRDPYSAKPYILFYTTKRVHNIGNIHNGCNPSFVPISVEKTTR